MSLEIEVDRVMSVLLADGWHDVAEKSFEIDAYEFIHGEAIRLSGGQAKGVCSTGVTWTGIDCVEFYCPLTSVLAVKC